VLFDVFCAGVDVIVNRLTPNTNLWEGNTFRVTEKNLFQRFQNFKAPQKKVFAASVQKLFNTFVLMNLVCFL